jgi:hypothetical protein
MCLGIARLVVHRPAAYDAMRFMSSSAFMPYVSGIDPSSLRV